MSDLRNSVLNVLLNKSYCRNSFQFDIDNNFNTNHVSIVIRYIKMKKDNMNKKVLMNIF